MQVKGLTAGARLLLEDGSIVEVLAPSEDGETVLVLCIESPFNEAMVGREGRCSDYDLVGFAGSTEMDSAAPPVN
jgi:hypothetical protein